MYDFNNHNPFSIVVTTRLAAFPRFFSIVVTTRYMEFPHSVFVSDCTSMKVLILIGLACQATFSGAMLLRGITNATTGATQNVTGGFVSSGIINPSGSNAAGYLTTPSPYQTYSPVWSDVFTIGWAPPANAYMYSMTKINKLSPDVIDPSWFLLKTASPVYPPPIVSSR